MITDGKEIRGSLVFGMHDLRLPKPAQRDTIRKIVGLPLILGWKLR
jgi:hypothetical protein